MCRAFLIVIGALLLSSCATAVRPLVLSPFADGRYWMLREPLTYRLGESKYTVVVPAGFVADFASIPRALWSVLLPTGRYMIPATVHDYLYWTQPCDREQ